MSNIFVKYVYFQDSIINCPFPNEQTEFSLPENDFNQLIRDRKSQSSQDKFMDDESRDSGSGNISWHLKIHTIKSEKKSSGQCHYTFDSFFNKVGKHLQLYRLQREVPLSLLPWLPPPKNESIPLPFPTQVLKVALAENQVLVHPQVAEAPPKRNAEFKMKVDKKIFSKADTEEWRD